MCEFFFVQAKDGSITEDALRSVLETAQEAAGRNGDGTGVFNAAGRVFRSARRLDGGLSRRIAALFAGSEMVVIHLRLATRGSTGYTNVHPFVADGLTLAHNGTVHGVDAYGDCDDADSKMLLRKIADQDGDTVAKVRSALESTSGWLSVFLLDREDGSLYYFRRGADLFVAENEAYRVAATERRRLGTRDATQPDAGVIYRVNAEGFNEVDTFQTASLPQRPVRTAAVFPRYGTVRYTRPDYHGQAPQETDDFDKAETKTAPWDGPTPRYQEAEG